MLSSNEPSEDTKMYETIPQSEYSSQNESEKKNKGKITIDRIKHRYPYSIVWTPIPCITWLFPSIGHAGICDSEGIIYDFAGPYYVSVDNMAFGNPTKFAILQLTQKEFSEYDKAVEYGRKAYNKLDYNFFTNNCHSFIAKVLNKLNYKGRNNYNMVDVWWILSTKSKYLSWKDLLKSYSGTLVIILIFFIIYSILKR